MENIENLIKDNLPMLTGYALNLIGVVAIFFGAWIIGGWLKKRITKILAARGFDETLAKFFANSSRWVVLALAAITCLSLFGINTASFAVVLGSAGLAVGLAFQGTLGNVASGVMLLIFRPFKVGQVVSVAGQTGKVHEIDLFVTTVDTPDNRRIIIPNGNVFGAVIENISFHEDRRVDVAVGTDYGADLDQTRTVLMKAIGGVDEALSGEGRDPAVVLLSLGGSSIDWQLRVWVKSENYFPVMDKLTQLTKKHLDDANIGIPFPQMDVHLDQVK